jgi:hypothetical protein
MRSGTEFDIRVLQAGQLRDPQASVHGYVHQRVVATAGPGLSVGGGEKGIDLGLIKVGQLVALGPLGGDGQHSGDEPGVFGTAQRRVAEEVESQAVVYEQVS